MIPTQEKIEALETAWRCPAFDAILDQCEEQGEVFDPETGLWFCAAHFSTLEDNR